MPQLTDKAERISPAAYWELLMNLTRREVKGRYSQSFFGIAWAIAQPLATMAVFTIVFSRLAKLPSEGVPYPIFAYAALVPWFFFSNSVASGTLSLVTYRNIVTKTYFPREIIPLAQVCSRLIDFSVAAALSQTNGTLSSAAFASSPSALEESEPPSTAHTRLVTRMKLGYLNLDGRQT